MRVERRGVRRRVTVAALRERPGRGLDGRTRVEKDSARARHLRDGFFRDARLGRSGTAGALIMRCEGAVVVRQRPAVGAGDVAVGLNRDQIRYRIEKFGLSKDSVKAEG